ncbi:dTDP-4-dehydrorhamnose 3,5-epimerase [Henriciella sp.]|uniref:dTDP-4-dehydrorhamnose 3,5-epimerase n=1 Tax=Henriciella sp. TaxID=1968823 RepID=UPI002619ECD1|nr:dTDP-4-dehydrorhamnose 3,5-epimerase [Henriciella sp.]
MPILNVESFEILGPLLITPKAHGDSRGWFCETWNARDWAETGLPDVQWVQDNHAFSAAPGTTRGLHFQAPPHAQAKLIQVLRGEIFDVIVDLRKGSPTYGQTLWITLDAKNHQNFFVPVGFAHGYQTLTTNTQVAYKVSDYYAPDCEGGLLWCDVDLNIPWPKPDDVVMSGRDFTWPTLANFDTPFDQGT